MSTAENPYASFGMIAAHAPATERAEFIRKTYLHLGGAILAFVALEAAILGLVPDETLASLVGTLVAGYNWLIVLGAFMLVSWIANSWASSSVSLQKQYLGLGLYVVAEAVIFVPLLYIASKFGGPGLIPAAGVLTLIVFAGLTAIVFFTGADLSGLGPYLGVAGLVAMGFILCSVVFHLEILGVVFSAAMIGLASGYILYSTSNVLHHYRTTQYVAAALALFAAVALLFWYILRLLMELNRR